MMAAGASADHAREMFDAERHDRVRRGGAGRGGRGAGPSRWPLARRLARPLERIAAAAARIADGDLEARVPEEGPAELRGARRRRTTRWPRGWREQEAVRREFIVNASHELRTPLTNLQGYLEALRDGVLPPDPATFDSLREEVDRLTRLAASLDVLAGRRGRARRGARGRRRGDRAASAATWWRRRSPGARSPCASRRRPGSSCAPGPTSSPRSSPTSSRTRSATRPIGGEVRGRRAEAVDDGVRVRVANTGPGIPPGRPAAGLGAVLPGREVARPGARRGRDRARDRAPAGRGRRAAAWASRARAAGRPSG